MKKKGKIILTVVLVLAIAAVAAAVAAFRPQPVLDPSGTYEVQRVNYWLEGPNLEWEGYLHTMPTPEQAQEILDNATIEANNVKSAAMQYMDDMLAHLENIISSSTQQASANYDALIGNLNQYRDIIQSNRSELHPVDEDLDDVDTAADAEDNLDVM